MFRVYKFLWWKACRWVDSFWNTYPHYCVLKLYKHNLSMHPSIYSFTLAFYFSFLSVLQGHIEIQRYTSIYTYAYTPEHNLKFTFFSQMILCGLCERTGTTCNIYTNLLTVRQQCATLALTPLVFKPLSKMKVCHFCVITHRFFSM